MLGIWYPSGHGHCLNFMSLFDVNHRSFSCESSHHHHKFSLDSSFESIDIRSPYSQILKVELLYSLGQYQFILICFSSVFISHVLSVKP
jgi:hypothetical protein